MGLRMFVKDKVCKVLIELYIFLVDLIFQKVKSSKKNKKKKEKEKATMGDIIR